MNDLADFWRYAPLWGSLLVLIVIAIVFRRYARSRTSATPPRAPARPWTGTEEENLDSSHIGGPIFVHPPDQHARPDAEGPAGGGGPAGVPK